MAISDKLNYLIETKSKFKDRLNSLGAEIIESTTFRNYLNWLDEFYGEVSDKTDLAKNGIVGRTSQDGDPTPENPVEIKNLSGDVEYKVRGQGISESFPLSLGDIELCNISDYKDRIYSQNGEFYLEKKTGKVVFDGSENWEKHATTAADIYMIFIPNSIGYEYGSGKIAPAICNSFIARALGSFSDYTYGVFGITPSFQTRFFVGATGSHYANINAWKQYLSNNNMLVYFALATPTTTEITEENYPTLYSQLQAIQEFLTKYKINKEFLLDYSSPEIEY